MEEYSQQLLRFNNSTFILVPLQQCNTRSVILVKLCRDSALFYEIFIVLYLLFVRFT